MDTQSTQSADGSSPGSEVSAAHSVQQRLWIAPVVMAGIFVATVLLLLLQMNMQVSTRSRGDLLAVSSNIEQSLRSQFQTDTGNFYKMANHQGTGMWIGLQLRRQAEDLLVDGRGLGSIACYDSFLNVVWATRTAQDSQSTGLDVTLPEPRRAARMAAENGRPEYTQPFRYADGSLVMAIFVPAFAGERVSGYVAGIYRIDELMQERIAPVLGDEYHAMLGLDPGNVLSEMPQTKPLSDVLKHRIDLDPPGHGFNLTITSYREDARAVIPLLVLLCCGLGIGLAWSSYNLRMKLADSRRARDELNAHRERLEMVVSERTNELARSNQQLQADIAERERTEKALQRSESTLRSILVAAPMGIALVRRNCVEWCNEHLAAMLGYDDDGLLGMEVRDLCEDDSVYRVTEAAFFRTGYNDTRISLRRRDGSLFMAQLHMALLDPDNPRSAAIAIVEDVSDKLKAEIGLRRAQKMQAIGTLAGGIAHDFNNILYAMTGYTQLALDDVEPGGDIEASLEQVIIAGRRAADLVHRILSFSNTDESEKRPLRLQSIVEDDIALLRGSLPATIELKLDIDDNCGAVLAEPTHMHQVLMNLGTNAYHAMRDGGVLTIVLREESLTPAKAAKLPDLTAGRYAALSVRDTGCGMDRNTVDRIFEPYFTTKEVGEGSGVGLATVHGIVAAHSGAVKVESGIGEGSSFTIYLPIFGHAGDMDDAVDMAGDRPHGRGVVLLVDDEKMIVELGREFLQRLGYKVEHFSDSRVALQAFRNSPETYDLVITDFTMPHLTGLDLTREMVAVRPDLPVILISGYGDLPDREVVAAAGVSKYLPKPISQERLARVVAGLLGRKEAGA